MRGTVDRRAGRSDPGLDGLTQFATTLEQMFGMFARGERPLDESAAELGRRGLAAIGNYLEELVHDTPDQPLRLGALYAEVAAACGLRGANAADLFFPDTSRRPPRNKARVARMEQAERTEQVRAQRALYQRGLLRVLRKQSDTGGARELLEAARNLEALHDKPAANALWWAAQAFFESLANADLPEDPMIKRLCTALDKELGRDTLASGNVPDRLMRDLLYFVALGEARSPLQGAQPAATSGTGHLAAGRADPRARGARFGDPARSAAQVATHRTRSRQTGLGRLQWRQGRGLAHVRSPPHPVARFSGAARPAHARPSARGAGRIHPVAAQGSARLQ